MKQREPAKAKYKDGEYWWVYLHHYSAPEIVCVSLGHGLHYIYPCGDEQGWKIDDTKIVWIPKIEKPRNRTIRRTSP
jgi:hypothetical protein